MSDSEPVGLGQVLDQLAGFWESLPRRAYPLRPLTDQEAGQAMADALHAVHARAHGRGWTRADLMVEIIQALPDRTRATRTELSQLADRAVNGEVGITVTPTARDAIRYGPDRYRLAEAGS